MTKIKILKVINKDEVSRNGKSYTKCSVKTTDKNNQEIWISGFGNTTTKNWVEGQIVELDIYQEEYNGKNYLKFKEVKERNIFDELDKIVAKLDTLSVYIQTANAKSKVDNEISDAGLEKIPF